MYTISYLSKNKILSILDEKTAFEHYFTQRIDLRRNKYLNPFRNDKHTGSCHFNYWKGSLYFFDKSTNEKYNLFSFVMKKYNCEYYQALYVINKDFNLNLKIDRIRLGNYLYNPFSIQKIVKPNLNLHKENFKSEFKVEVQDFTEDDLLYWSQYNITLEDLNNSDINVKSVKKYYVSNGYSWKLTYSYNSKDPCFLYTCKNYIETDEEIYLKIYRPLSDKENKWRTNYNNNAVQNYYSLPLNSLSNPSQYIFITSSLKDGICLKKMGFNFIVPSSESTYLTPEIIKELKYRFKEKLYIFYDNDLPGIHNATNHSYLYQIPYISLPTVDDHNKDVSDYVKAYGYNFTKHLIDINIKNHAKLQIAY